MMDSDELVTRLQKKTSWGRNEILAEVQSAYETVLEEMADL